MKTNKNNNTAEILNLQTDSRVMRETAKDNAAERYPFAYVLNVGGKFHSLVNAEQWETQDEMQSTKFGIWNGAHLFKKSATVFVYALCRDGFYRLCTSMNVHPGEEILPAFHMSTARPGQTRPRPTAKVGHKSAAGVLPDRSTSDANLHNIIPLFFDEQSGKAERYITEYITNHR